MARSCEFCRRRKIKCDASRPTCATCRSGNRLCVYHNGPPKQRPSAARIESLESEKAALEQTLLRLKGLDEAERGALLESVTVRHGRVTVPHPNYEPDNELNGQGLGGLVDRQMDHIHCADGDDAERDSHDGGGYTSTFQQTGPSTDEGIFSSTSVVQASRSMRTARPGLAPGATTDALRYQLIANAAMQRQQEHRLRGLATIRGIPAALVLHLLDLHWSRQHHTFLLTYRPTFMRELEHGGPYCSDLLLYTVLACASKFSEQPDPETGERFFARCDELLLHGGLLTQSSIPTVITLIMLGSTFIARGMTSKGWLYTGYAMRMIYDLDLHTETGVEISRDNIEQIEIRRRVFWGAFVCEKLQSLYLGRPPTIRLLDVHVPQEFLDTFEELEPWQPYTDGESCEDSGGAPASSALPSTYSVSVFQQLCLLSQVMAQIIDKVYFVGSTQSKARHEVRPLDDALSAWYRDLPAHLTYEPWRADPRPPMIAPNRIILLTTYHSLLILLHRPFITASAPADTATGPPVSASSWQRCAAAARHITALALSYRSVYPLRKSSYLLGYAVYVACTIHVLATASLLPGSDAHAESSTLLSSSLECLDALAIPNSGAADTARIIRRLMAANGLQESPHADAVRAHASDCKFSSTSCDDANAGEFEQLQSAAFQDFSLLGQDLLFGFMNENMPPITSTIDIGESVS
ncbi:transcription factor domain-containing protein [Aspergillus foveolatus]|uniref:transcription factor domain-containing protein n=1 Tax=Aspergillus foveolatus TaxID=210207 RepID=UPI003CCCFD63